MTESTLLFAFLLLGHTLGDFVFQSYELVQRKREPKKRMGALFEHARILALCHALAALPVLSAPVLLALVPVVAVHAVVDWIKLRVEEGKQNPLAYFLLDQVAHLATLWAAATLLSGTSPWLWTSTDASLSLLFHTALFTSAWILAMRGGGFVVAMVLAACKVSEPSDDDTVPLGRVIGNLERLLIVTLVLQDAWAGIGLILAAKSIARFKELEQRKFGEYYLVGTLTSVLAAVVVGLGIRAISFS